jgi:hypothetical protein
VRKFIATIGESIYSPNLYRGILTRSFSSSFGYFVLLCLLLSSISAIWVSVDIVPSIRNDAESVVTSFARVFPDDLSVTIAAGKAMSSIPGPIFINLFASSSIDTKTEIGATNFLVVDTQNPFTLEQYKNYDSLIWLTGEGIITRNREGKIEIVSLQKIATTTIDKAYVVNAANKISPLISVFAYLMPILIFLVAFVYYFSTLLYLLIGALIVWLVAYLCKVELGYKKSYQLALHAVTLPLILNLIIFGTDFTLFASILIAVVAWVNLRKDA